MTKYFTFFIFLLVLAGNLKAQTDNSALEAQLTKLKDCMGLIEAGMSELQKELATPSTNLAPKNKDVETNIPRAESTIRYIKRLDANHD